MCSRVFWPSRAQVGFGLGLADCPPFWVVLCGLFVFGLGNPLNQKGHRMSLTKCRETHCFTQDEHGLGSGLLFGGASISLANVWSSRYYNNCNSNRMPKLLRRVRRSSVSFSAANYRNSEWANSSLVLQLAQVATRQKEDADIKAHMLVDLARDLHYILINCQGAAATVVMQNRATQMDVKHYDSCATGSAYQ